MANLRLGAAVTATKWVGLAAAMWVQASGGNAYMFAFYSSKLKSVLHYNQVQVNNLGVAKDLGENVGLLAGYLCNKVPPWALLSIGAAAGFLGYGVTWLVVSERIGALPYWQVKQASIIRPPPLSTFFFIRFWILFQERRNCFFFFCPGSLVLI
jgi:hypothetical protein